MNAAHELCYLPPSLFPWLQPEQSSFFLSLGAWYHQSVAAILHSRCRLTITHIQVQIVHSSILSVQDVLPERSWFRFTAQNLFFVAMSVVSCFARKVLERDAVIFKVEMATKIAFLSAQLETELSNLDVGKASDMLLRQVKDLNVHAQTFLEEKEDEDQICSAEFRRPTLDWSLEVSHDDQSIPPAVSDDIAGLTTAVEEIFDGPGGCNLFQQFRHVDVSCDYLWQLEELLGWTAGGVYARELQGKLPQDRK